VKPHVNFVKAKADKNMQNKLRKSKQAEESNLGFG
jgi:hypothetical protein